MKKILLALLLMACQGVSAAGIQNLETTNTSRGALQTIVGAIGTYQQLQQNIREKNVALDFEKNLEFQSLVEIDRVNTALTEKQAKLTKLENQFAEVLKPGNSVDYDESDENIVEGLIATVQAEIEALKDEKKGFETTYKNRKQRQEENLKNLSLELDNLKEEVLKQRKIIEVQILNFGSYVLFFVVLAIGFWGLKFFGRFIIKRSSKAFSEPRRQALLRVNDITFNVLLALVVFGIIFSQFVNFLPFLAILGTGVAFAVRDTISSFIAWFVIGTERGYKRGDIIEIEEVTGQVIEIKPLLTALKDLTPGWNTGKIISIPNKIIFEEKIYNHSRSNGFFKPLIEFLVTEDSNIDEAKTLLIESINQAFAQKQGERAKKLPATKDDQEPVVWIESTIHGMELKARFWCSEDIYEAVLHAIHENFTQQVQKSKKVHFQFVEIGRQAKPGQPKSSLETHIH